MERRAHVERAMAQAGAPYQFFSAIVGDDGAQFAGRDDARFLSLTGRLPLAGEYGCYASHMALWQECAARGISMIIAEDDIDPQPRFAYAAALALDLADRCGFVRLESETRARKSRIARIGSFEVWQYTKASQGALCYAISPSVARNFLRASALFSMPVDVFIRRYWDHGQPLFGLTPYVATRNAVGASSTIGTRRKAARSLPEHGSRFVARVSDTISRQAFNLRRAGLSPLLRRLDQRRT